MNITIDKVLLWTIPYLYLISILYYWGYWGTFNIDVFNYYAVGDLVKGVISPLRLVLSTVLIGIIAIAAVEWISSIVRKKSNTVIITTSFVAASLLFAFLLIGTHFVTGDHPDAYHSEGLALYLFISTVWYFIAARLTTRICGNITEAYESGRLGHFLGVFLLLVFPSKTFFNAKNEALLTMQNKEFSYVIKDGITTKEKGIYKYLGKVGEYHILLTRDNSKSIIVPTALLMPLIIQKVSLSDSASLRQYRMNNQALSVTQKL